MASSPRPHESASKKKRPGSLANAKNMPQTILAAHDSTQVSQKAATSTTGERSISAAHFKLLELPSELLLQIASQLCGTEAILRLSLANKRLNGVAQEAMRKRLVIRPNRILDVINMLIRRPELIPKANIVHLGKYMLHDFCCLCRNNVVFDRKARRVLRNAIARNTGGKVTWNQLQQSKRLLSTVWGPTHRFLLDVLVSLCPNIRELTIELPAASGFDKSPAQVLPAFHTPALPTANPNMTPVTPIEGAALEVLRNKLEALTIPEGSSWKGPAKIELLAIDSDLNWKLAGKHLVTLPGFSKMKRLDVPMDALGLPQSIVFQSAGEEPITTVYVATVVNDDDNAAAAAKNQTIIKLRMPAKILPLSLTTLRLRSCNSRAFALLQVINNVPADKLKLQHVDLHFKTSCARSVILQCYKTDDGNLDHLRLLMELERKNVKVTFHFGRKARVVNMCRELTPLYFLSPTEAGLISLLNKQFSAVNQTAVIRRWFSPIARQLFVKHALHHFDLLNSPTLDANAWSNVCFFHGSKNTKWDPEILRRSDKAKYKDDGIGEPNRRRNALLDLSFSVFSFQAKREPHSALRRLEFLGKTFTMPEASCAGPETGRKSMTRKDLNATLETSIEINVESDQETKRRGEGTKKLDQAAVKLSKHGREEEQFAIHFKGLAVHSEMYGGTKTPKFDGGFWAKLDWKHYLQPHAAALNAA